MANRNYNKVKAGKGKAKNDWGSGNKTASNRRRLAAANAKMAESR